ncbi:unnamed protein product [Clonostachys solani]|uniref:Uncharacterized protein n=1 Tax=Clonostachys solani TaxID=160281 RepID=A0A9N9ZDQ3_9HYPO|nr:unnamed protein product [Clonostachys solani]
MALHRLPHETLQQIACHLADSHRPSLYAFGLASKACYNVASVHLFRQIRLAIHGPEELQRDVNALTETLSRAASFRSVHTLKLQGFLEIERPRNSSEENRNDIDHLGWWKSTLVNEPRINTLLPNTEPVHRGDFVSNDEPVIEPSSEEDKAWAPVVNLINQLSALATLVYDCPNQFPPSLLDTLHRHPRCKLHHLKFRLRTVSSDTVHPYEMALATSPRLYSARLYCTWRDSEGNDDFNHEAMRDLTAGLAPNLKEVTVVKLWPMRSNKHTWRRGRWNGLPGYITDGKMIGSLTSLSLVGTVSLLSPALLKTWAAVTDFNCLRHLALGGEGSGYMADHVNGINGEVMEWIASNCSFAQLKVVRLVLERDANPSNETDYRDSAVSLFTALPPLTELSVTGPLDPTILDAILYRHGQTLEKLNLHSLEDEADIQPDEVNRHEVPMVFTEEHMRQIQAQCPILEELAVPVKRTQSDAAEVEIYKTFAKMESLKSLFLILDCSDWRVTRDSNYGPDPSFDEYDRETWSYDDIKKGHLRVALINSAVDEKLARSIWDIVNQQKSGRQLESLKLWTTGGGSFGNNRREATGLLASLSCSWLVTRLARDDSETINIEELGRLAREAREQKNIEEEVRWKKVKKTSANAEVKKKTTSEEWQANREEGELPSELTESELNADLDTETLRIFRRIWPRQEESKGWRKDWSSFALQT